MSPASRSHKPMPAGLQAGSAIQDATHVVSASSCAMLMSSRASANRSLMASSCGWKTLQFYNGCRCKVSVVCAGKRPLAHKQVEIADLCLAVVQRGKAAAAC